MKYEELVDFKSTERLMNFIKEIEWREENFYIISGQYSLNAKSILSVIALATEHPIIIQVNSCDESVKKIIDKYKYNSESEKKNWIERK